MEARKHFLLDESISIQNKLQYIMDHNIVLSPECLAGFADVVFYRSLNILSRFDSLGFQYDYKSYLDHVREYNQQLLVYNDLDENNKKENKQPVFLGEVLIVFAGENIDRIQSISNTAIMSLYRFFINNNNKKSNGSTSDVENLILLFSITQILTGNAKLVAQYALKSLENCNCYDLAVNTLNYHIIKNIDLPPLTCDLEKFSKKELLSRFKRQI